MEKHENEAFEGLKKYISDGTPADIVERYASLPELVDQIDLGHERLEAHDALGDEACRAHEVALAGVGRADECRT